MNLANLLTASRLAIAPVFAYSFLTAMRGGLHVEWLWAALACAALIEVSDFFDGRVARSRNEVSDFGKIFDPVCDSLSRQTIFISFLLTGIIPLWMFLIFLYRDSLMSFLRIMCAVDGTVMAAKRSGKMKAVFQAAGTFLVLAMLLAQSMHVIVLPQKLWGRHPGFWIMLFPAVFTFLSMFDYLLPNLDVIKRRMTSVKR